MYNRKLCSIAVDQLPYASLVPSSRETNLLFREEDFATPDRTEAFMIETCAREPRYTTGNIFFFSSGSLSFRRGSFLTLKSAVTINSTTSST